MARDIYSEVQEQIIEALDKGVVPWRQPIKPSAHGDGYPKSLQTKKRYRGINVFLLALISWTKGYASNYWATFNQIKKQEGQVRKGEKASLVIFWKQVTKTDQDSGDEYTMPILRHYNVFNVEQ